MAEEEGVEDVEGGDVSAPLPYHDTMGACSGRAEAALMLGTNEIILKKVDPFLTFSFFL